MEKHQSYVQEMEEAFANIQMEEEEQGGLSYENDSDDLRFMSQRVATDIGNYIGKYIDGDPNNFVGVWRDYLRIRVTLSLLIPVKRRMKLKKSGNEWCWVNFQYESIPTFCFICGIIGHGEKFCDKIFDTPIENIEKPYGPWLRADPRRKTHTMGARWLRSGGSSQARNSGEMRNGINTRNSWRESGSDKG
ncbi:hypothetical protein POM88_039140 [Heracleum sosnowskyi]|uniref:Zinc knuckle CX2CX4HX4C domain-containing protein n=1 Tax=Heracleum sosnowskyi TaxID=360622 RepID=A0AAD8HAN3_9APIA|nr:hypothetical protein POM88_039140 [Heracleum sosnowskyi]